MKLHKCQFCTDLILPEEEMKYKDGYAHTRCFNVHVKATQQKKEQDLAEKVAEKKHKILKPKAELKEGLTEEQWQEKQDFYNFIKELTHEEPTAKTRVLTENYIKKYEFTYSGIKQALQYFYQINNHDVTADCMGIIPYIYEEAQLFFSQQHDLISKIQNACKDGVIPKNPERRIIYKPVKEQLEFLSMENIR